MKLPDAVKELPETKRKLWQIAFDKAYLKYNDRTDGEELAGAEAWDHIQASAPV